MICPPWVTRDLSGLERPSKGGSFMRRTEVLQGIRFMKFTEILDRTSSRELSQGEAALGVSERTFRRWRERFEAEGAEGLYDRRLGKISARRWTR